MNGIIIINKPQNWTSNDVVQKIKHITHEKVGHTGTLDPLATGVLPLLIGKATQCSKYLINHDKIYNVKLKLGIKTDTKDREGKIIEKSDVDSHVFEKNHIEQTLKTFLGEQTQTPPIYSAIRVNGKKLYEYARKGQSVEIPKRNITIYKIELKRIDEENQIISFKVHCSKGTYIRSLCEDIATKLGTIGCMQELERNQVGNFSLKNAIILNNDLTIETIEENLITIEEVCNCFDKTQVPSEKLNLFLNGVQINKNLKDGTYRLYCDSKFIGTGTIKNYKLKRDIII